MRSQLTSDHHAQLKGLRGWARRTGLGEQVSIEQVLAEVTGPLTVASEDTAPSSPAVTPPPEAPKE